MKNYVKRYKGRDVPDGAAHYNDKNRCFYNKDKTRYYNTECVGVGWTDLNFKTYAENSTELPEQDLPNWDDAPTDKAVWMEYDSQDVGRNFSGWYHKKEFSYYSCNTTAQITREDEGIEYTIHKRPIAIEDKEWLPTNGEWCQHKYEGKYEDVFIVGLSKGNYFVYQNKKSDVYYTGETDEFRPLKTAEEVVRDMFVEIASTVICSSEYESLLGSLFDAGFTAPKGEG